MANAQVKFVSRNDGWKGVGRKDEPNSYDVLVSNKGNVGMLWYCSDRGWRFHRKEVEYIDGYRFEYQRHPAVEAQSFKQAKSAVKDLLS